MRTKQDASLDLTTKDSDGQTWGLSQMHLRKGATDNLMKEKPVFLIGSVMSEISQQ